MENLNDKIAEFKYHMFSRPFGIGTYPIDNFVRWEDDNTRYGVLVYSKPVPIKDFSHYSLVPITEAEKLDGITLYWREYPISLKLKINHRNVYVFETALNVEGEIHNDFDSVENIMTLIEKGEYTFIIH